MTKERIVLETTDQRKAALVQALSLQGESLSDWLEEQLTLSVPDIERTLIKDAGKDTSIADLADAKNVLAGLTQQDWAFTDDDTRYLTHDLHPYPAKFIPQIPAYLIAALSMRGDIVFDPFGGSGTTAVEAVRLGRRAVSLDANPLSALIGKVKTGFMTPSVQGEIDQLQAAVSSHIAGSELKKAGWAAITATRYHAYVPDIPNIEKWFHENATAELALLRFLIDKTTSGLAEDAALLALSRIVTRVSFQESETRYVAEHREIPLGLTLRAFLESLRTIARRLANAAPDLQRTDARFLVADSRTEIGPSIGDGSVDLIVTSPPYPNATDYHLYHRFRLFWLGFDPRKLGTIEIGSHLKHQRNNSGFDEYCDDMRCVVASCFNALQPGRYAVFVVGDALFKAEVFSTGDAIVKAAQEVGFEHVGTIDRPIHETKRSFAKPARRARRESLVILRRPDHSVRLTLIPPAYKMWPYEVRLRQMEIEVLAGHKLSAADFSGPVSFDASLVQLSALRRLTFTREFVVAGKNPLAQPTWQKVLENGDADSTKRKDPKYATHGLHPYKGKFYPQLAKSLMNISGIPIGARLLDPFCGSGTSLLEGMLSGLASYGCDMHPLAAKIARAKTGIFSVDRSVTEQALRALLTRVRRPPAHMKSTRDQFAPDVRGELDAWFPAPVLDKLEWLLSQIRLFGENKLIEFGETILSSIIRDVSQQEPTDLRIRRRKEPIADAPVVELFAEQLTNQLTRLVKYWSIAGRQPASIIAPMIVEGDCRTREPFQQMGLTAGTVDCIVTSPPYATALPYIDTDRLSLMAIMGIEGSTRTRLEENLTGSREIRRRAKDEFENELLAADAMHVLPRSVVSDLRMLFRANRSTGVGFRRDNMASLLWRYFIDMKANLAITATLLKPGARAFYVVGDSRTKAGNDWIAIETCKHVSAIAEMVGLEASTLLDISVTTENLQHIKNAITENGILEFRRPV